MMNVTFDDKDKNIKDGVHNVFSDSNANEIKRAVNSKADAAKIGQSDGIAPLGSDGKIPSSFFSAFGIFRFSIDVSGSNISFDCQEKDKALLEGDDIISTSKNWLFLNVTTVNVFNILVDLQTLLPQTLPANVKRASGMSDYDNTAHEFTPTVEGIYVFEFLRSGTDWLITQIQGPF